MLTCTTVRSMRDGYTMRRSQTFETPTLHDTLESFSNPAKSVFSIVPVHASMLAIFQDFCLDSRSSLHIDILTWHEMSRANVGTW